MREGWMLRTKGFDTERGAQQVLAKPLSLSLLSFSPFSLLLSPLPNSCESLHDGDS